MKKIFRNFLFVALISYPSYCMASFLVELENGTRFVTSRYWEEGGKIKFILYGGVAGFEKNVIKNITTTELPVDKEISTGDNEIKEQQKSPPLINEEEKATFIAKRDEIIKKMDELQRAKDKAQKKKVPEKAKTISMEWLASHDEYQNLFSEILKKNGGSPPDWWPTLWLRLFCY